MKNCSKAATAPEWFFSDVITITSLSGGGKSSTLERFEMLFGATYRYVSGGTIFRAFAKEVGMSIEEFTALNARNSRLGYDLRCDDELRRAGLRNHAVIETRVPHVVPHAFHVLLTCPQYVRSDRRRTHPKYKHLSHSEVYRLIGERDRDDKERYNRLYPGSMWPECDYDAVVSTNINSTEKVVEEIIRKHKVWHAENASKIRTW